MAAATPAKTRPTHGLHLGSFSRMDIADYEGAGQSRYPTVPSPSARPVSLADPSAMGQQVPLRQYEPIQNLAQPQPQPGTADATSDNSAVLPQAGNQDFSAAQPTSRRPYAFQTPYPVFVAPLQAAQQAQPVGLPEEVCIECMMRDRDMADVDVTSPGIWERDSDADLRDLIRREDEDERRAAANGSSPPKRTSVGGRLTEQNLKVWLTMNPKEPTARWQTLEAYLKTQASLLEAEANARAQAMHESRALENKMRDTYSQLRRSAYDAGTTAAQDDGTGGVRIKAPRPTSGSWGEAADRQKREVTLLESGMILERVDVRKEEKEERERRKKEERKWRKSSAGMDSNPPSPGIDYPTTAQLYDSQPATSQAALSAFSAASSARPMSTAATSPNMRPQASVGSADASANRNSRFMAFRQWSGAFGSSPSIAPSGSMIDMHLGLSQDRGMEIRSAAGAHGPGRGRRRPRTADAQMQMTNVPRTMSPGPDPKAKKKKTSGIGKLWKKVTGSSSKANGDAKNASGTDDDRPLTPPPPISYLVNRGSDRISPHSRHASTPTLVMSSPSPIQHVANHPRAPSVPQSSISPVTAQSSLLPSPTSNRFPWRDSGSDGRNSGGKDEIEVAGSPLPMEDMEAMRNLSLNGGDDAKRSQSLQVPGAIPVPSPTPSPRPASMFKTLPPLPPGEGGKPDNTPPLPPGAGIPNGFETPNPGFRSDGTRRQSFGGTAARPATQVLADGSQQQYRTVTGVNRHHHPQHSATDPNPTARYPGDSRHPEFGMARRSTGRLDLSLGGSDDMSQGSPDKRRSKFGFGSLFNKKDKDKHRDSKAMAQGMGTSYPRTSFHPQSQSMYLGAGPEAYDLSISPTLLSETLPPGPGTMRSSDHRPLSSASHAPPPPGAGSAWPPPGMQSSKRIDDLVDRDPDFVAYRYPSSDVTLDIRR